MKPINKALLVKFIELAGKKLTGRWVMIGGTVLPLLDSEFRPTIDIDIIGLPLDSSRETLVLMQIVEDLGLPIETINQAGAYFLSKIDDFEESLVLLHRGSKATLYRPNVNLFIRLKMDRLSETDLADCLEFIRIANSGGDKLNRSVLARKVMALVKTSTSSERTQRLGTLLEALQKS